MENLSLAEVESKIITPLSIVKTYVKKTIFVIRNI